MLEQVKSFFKSLLERVESKVILEVANFKAKAEYEKQQLIADFTAEENKLKARIEEICAYPEVTPVVSTTTTTTPVDTAPVDVIQPTV